MLGNFVVKGAKMKNIGLKIVRAVLLVACGSSIAYSQVALLEKPAANLTEKWDSGSSGWVSSSSWCFWTNKTFVIQCPYQPLGDPLGNTIFLSAKTDASGGIFSGNYSNIEAVSFDAQPTGLTSIPYLYFISAVTGRRWRTPCLEDLNGPVVARTIPLVYSADWLGSSRPDAEMLFNIDKTNIREIGFVFDRPPSSVNPEQFVVDNFKLIGPWTGPFSNNVPLAWVIEMGLTNDFAQVGLIDSDNDSFSNAAEFLAGTDPTNSASFFRIEIGRNDAGQMVIKWNGNRNASYELQEANILGVNSDFTVKTNISPASSKTEEVAINSQDGGASKFFKVLIKSK